jgi:signal transduction histidine kinase
MKNKRLLVITSFLILLIHLLGLFEAINEKIYDNFINLNRSAGYSNEIVLIEIDDKSINRLGKWPWNRSLFLRLLETIEGYPAVTGMMISFTEPSDENTDRALYNKLLQLDNVVLLAKHNFKDVEDFTLAVPEDNLYKSVSHGHGLLNYSLKGIVESIPPLKHYPAFALAVLNKYSQSEKISTSSLNPGLLKILREVNDADNFYSIDKNILIDYRKTPSQFKHYSFVDVLDGKVTPELLKNKIVLIGITDRYLTKTYITPFTGIRAKTKSSTGVELQAQIIDSLLLYRGLKECPSLISNIISIILTIVFFMFIRNKTVLHQGFYLLSFVAGIGLIDYLMFVFVALWFPPALLLILVILTFGLSEHFTSSKIDNILIETIDRMKTDESPPLKEISKDISGRMTTLTDLLEIISHDRQMIQKIIDSVNSGIIVFNTEGNIIWVNARIKEIFNDNDPVKISDLFEELYIENIEKAISASNIFKSEIKIKDQDFLCICNKITLQSGQYVAILNDITELKQADRLKSDMVRMVSHELKNPLASIRLCAENILFLKESEASTGHAIRIVGTTEHLLDTINNFLNISKLENNLMETTITPRQILPVIRESIEIQQTIAENKYICINFAPPENMPSLMMDSRQILTVMNILLSNAIKYSHENSEIIVKTWHEDDKAFISVIDHGIGIPEDDIDKIFNKFYRSSNNKENNIEGTGLGLTIIKMILNNHNGDITVKSTYKEGSTFTFSLPVHKNNSLLSG